MSAESMAIYFGYSSSSFDVKDCICMSWSLWMLVMWIYIFVFYTSENDELSSEREDERPIFPSKSIVQKALSSKARSFSSLREDLSKFPLPPQEKNVTPRSALSMEVEKTPYFPLEEVWKGRSVRMELEKIALLSLEKAPKAPPSPFESPAASVSEEFERPFASISDECERPFASISDEECEHPFVSVLDKEARRSMINTSSSYSQNKEATSDSSFYDCRNKEVILQEGYAPSIEVTKEIEQSRKTLTINVKKQEPLDRNTSVINSRRRSEADENRTNIKAPNGIIGKKLNSLPSSPFSRGAKQVRAKCS